MTKKESREILNRWKEILADNMDNWAFDSEDYAPGDFAITAKIDKKGNHVFTIKATPLEFDDGD